MRKNLVSNTVLFILVALITLLITEGALNLMVKPSTSGSGVLFGIHLPPLRVLPSNMEIKSEAERRADLNNWTGKLVVDGNKITYSDLWGIFQEDARVGYIPVNNELSTNGWWQSNNPGARARQDTKKEKPPGTRKVLFFGHSYTQGSRVSQEETFQHYMNLADSTLEAINFGVDGLGI